MSTIAFRQIAHRAGLPPTLGSGDLSPIRQLLPSTQAKSACFDRTPRKLSNETALLLIETPRAAAQVSNSDKSPNYSLR
jgi:hypothetical protein